MKTERDRLLTRAEITRLAGVKRPAINNWEKRHADFPKPVIVDGEERFAASEVAVWLAKRRIPSDARGGGEPEGITYADRFLRNLDKCETGRVAAVDAPDERLIGHAVGELVSRFRDYDLRDVRWCLFALVYLRGREPHQWEHLVKTAREAGWPARLVVELERAMSGEMAAHGLDSRLMRHIEAWLGLPREIAAAIELLNGFPPDHMAAFLTSLIERLTEVDGRAGGEYFTPRSIVRLAVGLLDPRPGHSVYDPFCRGGEFLAAAIDHVGAVHGGASVVTVAGDSPSETARGLAWMNVALHGAEAILRLSWPAPTDRTFDRVLTNPPFNMSSGSILPWDESVWRYGIPPARRLNYGWLQYALSSLEHDGRAAVLMSNHAVFAGGVEQSIRTAMVEDGAVEGLVALPSQLFAMTSIPVTLWLLRHPTGEPGDVLFVDATRMGHMVSRTLRELRGADIARIVDTYMRWRDGSADAQVFAHIATVDEIRAEDYSLNPLTYVKSQEADSRSVADRLREAQTLSERLGRLRSHATEVDATVERIMGGLRRCEP